MKQPRSSFLERKWAMVEKGDGVEVVVYVSKIAIGI